MKHALLVLAAFLPALPGGALRAADLTLSAPLDFQVVQRQSPGKGLVRISGRLSEEAPAGAFLEARWVEPAN